MPKQIIWLIAGAVVIVGLGAALFIAQPKAEDHSNMNQTVSGKALDLKMDPGNHDFGTISMKNGLVTKSFKVKNNQSTDVDLAKLYTSCMCTEARIRINGQAYGPFGMQGHGAEKMLHQTLKSGAEAELLVTFDPNAHGPSGIGVIERTVTLQSNDGAVASVNIKANVTP